jgi:hypothetical protein
VGGGLRGEEIGAVCGLVCGAISGIAVAHVAEGRASFRLRRVLATALGSAAVLAFFAVPVRGLDVTAAEGALAPLAAGAGAIALVQVVAAAAGRGKPPPLRRADPWVRAVVGLPVLLTELFGMQSWSARAGSFLPEITVVAAVAVTVLAARLVARLGGGSVLVSSGVAMLCARAAMALDVRMVLPLLLVLLPLLVTVAAMRMLRIDRALLSSAGITVWAAADLGLAAYAAIALVGIILATIDAAGAPGGGGELWLAVPLALVALLGFLRALSYIRRCFAIAEAYGRGAAPLAPVS